MKRHLCAVALSIAALSQPASARGQQSSDTLRLTAVVAVVREANPKRPSESQTESESDVDSFSVLGASRVVVSSTQSPYGAGDAIHFPFITISFWQ